MNDGTRVMDNSEQVAVMAAGRELADATDRWDWTSWGVSPEAWKAAAAIKGAGGADLIVEIEGEVLW